MAKTTKKQRKYKSPKTILRKTLEFFRANPENWTTGTLHRRRATADGGVAHCVLGGCLAFADSQKIGNTAIRYLAEAMGLKNAQTAPLEDVKSYVYRANDGQNGRTRALNALEKAAA